MKTMLKYLATKEKGFTLMELLIAVAIVAVLAGVGIPIYMKLQGGAKATEANANVDGIRTSLEAYKMVNNNYINATVAPRAVGVLDQNQAVWAGTTGFDAIGFQPNAGVRFVYAAVPWTGAAAAAVDATDYYVGALGDTNADGNRILYVASESYGPRPVDNDADADDDDGDATAALTDALAFGAAVADTDDVD
jgi:prepilin-type N-terminal cleavage/methylation domain-containing protein